MSIISWTSPSPSARILPISRLTSSPSGSLWLRRASARRRTWAPRSGGGSIRHASNVSTELAVTTTSYSSRVAWVTAAMGSPVAGFSLSSSAPVVSSHPPA